MVQRHMGHAPVPASVVIEISDTRRRGVQRVAAAAAAVASATAAPRADVHDNLCAGPAVGTCAIGTPGVWSV